jgi:radical SAM superfamily enzyme YgiQ (UPF0313 family)
LAKKDGANNDVIETYGQSEIPYWCVCLASYLKSQCYQSKILDYQSARMSDSLISKMYMELDTSKLVGISCNTNNYHIAVDIMRGLRQLDSELIFVIGGPHASFTSNNCIADGFDFVVKSSGENAILALCKAENKGFLSLDAFKESLLSVNNLVFSYEGNIINNRNLDCGYQSFVEMWKKLDFSVYQEKPGIIRLFTSLGCNCQCSFCADTIWNRHHIIFFPPDLIEKHINYLLSAYSPKYLLIGDENFLHNEEHFMRITSMLSKYGIPYLCQSRIDSVTEKKIRQLKATNCKLLQLGVESSSDTILRKSRKGICFSQVLEKLNLIKSFNLNVLTYWLVGLPEETEETIKTTVDWIVYFIRNKMSYLVDYYLFTPYPGTPVYENPDLYDIKIQKDADYSKWREDAVTIYELPTLSPQQLYDEWKLGLSKISQAFKEDTTP